MCGASGEVQGLPSSSGLPHHHLPECHGARWHAKGAKLFEASLDPRLELEVGIFYRRGIICDPPAGPSICAGRPNWRGAPDSKIL